MSIAIARVPWDRLDPVTGTDGDDTLTGGSGDDTLKGLKGDDLLSGGAGNDTLIGGAGDDTLKGGAGVDVLKGGGGVDFADYSNSTGVQLDFHHAVTDGGTDVLKSIEGAFLGAGDDVVTGTRWDNVIYDKGGHDLIDLGDGDDRAYLSGPGASTVDGGWGDDLLVGGDGKDSLIGGNDDDTLLGGAGDDVLNNVGGNDSIDGGAGDDLIESNLGEGQVQTLDGGDGDDHFLLAFNGIASQVDGGDGYDTLTSKNLNNVYIDLNNGHFTSIEAIEGCEYAGIGGSDHLQGNQDRPTYIDGRAGDDLLYGGDLGDTLVGGGTGFNQEDYFSGGGGGDTIIGGGRYDQFAYAGLSDSTPDAPDRISGFQDTNYVRLDAIDADTTKNGDQAFTLTHQLSHHAGTLAVFYDAGTNLTSFAGDVDGDAKADFLILVEGDHSHFEQFIL